MSSEQAKALVQKLVEAGEWPEPALLGEILAQGQEAVESLLEVVRSRPHGWPAEAPLSSAIVLLCILRPPEAMQPLVGLLRDYDSETAELVSEDAAVYGPDIVEPALAVTRDSSLAWYSRAAAADLAIRAAGEDAALRARIAATLREALRQQLALAPRYTGAEAEQAEAEDATPAPGSADDYYALTTSLVSDLALLADPEARSLIDQAFEADAVDTFMIDKKEVARSYREGDGTWDKSDPRDSLERYRTEYEHHRAEERRKPLDIRQTDPESPPAAFESDYLEPRPQPFVKEERKPGRNEPCCCGSGKKYKNCHMRTDRQ